MIPFVSSSVLIVDDHAGFRTAARAMLDQMGLRVLGEAESGEGAIESVLELRPDIVLLDIQLPGIDGIEVARRLQAVVPPPVIVLTSTRDAVDYGSRLVTVPAAIFVAKSDLTRESLDEAIQGTG